jgi:hypothetical protein
MAEGKKSRNKVVAAGDIAIDWLQWPHVAASGEGAAGSPLNWQLHRQVRIAPRAGGSLLLASWLSATLGADVSGPGIDVSRIKPADAYIHSFVSLEKFPVSKNSGAASVFRIKLNSGYTGPVLGKGRR